MSQQVAKQSKSSKQNSHEKAFHLHSEHNRMRHYVSAFGRKCPNQEPPVHAQGLSKNG